MAHEKNRVPQNFNYNVDECLTTNFCNNGICNNTIGGFDCTCFPNVIGTRCETQASVVLRQSVGVGGITKNNFVCHDFTRS